MNQRMDLTGVEIASVEMKSNEYPLFYKIDESGLIKNSGLIKIFKIELPGNWTKILYISTIGINHQINPEIQPQDIPTAPGPQHEKA